MKNLHGIIFAYLSNPALKELTEHRNTSSVPYGGRYRMIDFMLSNMVNGGVDDVGLIVHEGYQSLLDHVGSGKDWDLSRRRGGLRILPPFGYVGKKGRGEYGGRMDALSGVYSYLQNIRQEYVVLAGGDTAINFPLNDVYEAHLKSGADITVLCSGQHRADHRNAIYLTMDGDGRVGDVEINPRTPAGYESLEIYLLSKQLLLTMVDYCAARGIVSLGSGVLAPLVKTVNMRPYFYEGYVARLQSVEGYFAASMDLLRPEVRADLFCPDRAIKTKERSDAPTYYGTEARTGRSLIADGCIIEGEVENSLLFRGVRVERGARISNCILMQGAVVQAGATLKNVIADKGVRVNAGRTLIGHESYPLAIAKNAAV